MTNLTRTELMITTTDDNKNKSISLIQYCYHINTMIITVIKNAKGD